MTGFKKWREYLPWGLLALLYSIPNLLIWPSGDEGLFAAHAARILQGQLPNVDFATPYLGGHLFYIALWFKLLGPSFWALRVGFTVLLVLFIPALYSLARKLMDRPWAAVATLFAFSLTVPISPDLGANWLASFCSLAALVTFLRAMGKEEAHNWTPWMIATGSLLAMAVSMKQTVGLYASFSVFTLSVLYEVFSASREPVLSAAPDTSSKKLPLGLFLALLGGTLIAFYLLWLTSDQPALHVLLLFVVPGIGVWAILAQKCWQQKEEIDWRALSRKLLVLAAGFGGFWVLYLLPFVLRGEALHYLYESLVVRPVFYRQALHQDIALFFSPFANVLLGLFFGGIFMLRKHPRIAVALLSLTMLWFATTIPDYRSWFFASITLFNQLPYWFLAGGVLYFYQQAKQQSLSRQAWLVLVYVVFSTFALVNLYPVYVPVGFASGVSLFALLLIYAASRIIQKNTRWQHIPVAIFVAYWGVFGFLNMHRYEGQPLLEFSQAPYARFTKQLPWPRGRLSIIAQDYQKKMSLIAWIETLGPKETFYIIDNPDLYFLTGRTNPTPYDYYFFSLSDGSQDLIQSLESQKVTYVVLDTHYQQDSSELRPNVKQYITQNYRVLGIFPDWVILKRYPF